MIIQKTEISPNHFGPDIESIPEHLRDRASYTLLPDGTYQVTINKTPEEIEAETQALRATSQLIVAEKLLNESLPIERIPDFAKSFDPPKKGEKYEKDWILRHPQTDELYKVIQPEITWEDWWEMEEVPALVTPLRSTTEVTPWKQPESTNPYMKGEKVTHKGKTWESDIDNNVWEPGVYGWTTI